MKLLLNVRYCLVLVYVSVQPYLFSVALIIYDAVVYIIYPLQNIKSQFVKVLNTPHFTSYSTLDPAH